MLKGLAGPNTARMDTNMSDQYAQLYSSYRWFVPTQFNIAQACVYRWAENTLEGRRPAFYIEDELGHTEVWSFYRVAETANRLAHGLTKMGVESGDRVAVIMGQRPEMVAAVTAVLAVGAVVVPLSTALNPMQLAARLNHSETRVALVDTLAGPDVLQAQMSYPGLSQIVGLGFQHDHVISWRTLLARQSPDFQPLATSSSSPALLLYDHNKESSRGALLPHRALIGSLPGFVASQNWFPRTNDVFWSPQAWTDPTSLLTNLLPVLYFGRPTVAALGGFVPEHALQIMEDYRVTNAVLSLDQLKQLLDELTVTEYRIALRALGILGVDPTSQASSLFERSHALLGIWPNRVVGVPEAHQIVGQSSEKWPSRPGSLGRPYPGHRAAILDKQGNLCPPGAPGELALHRLDRHGFPDPALFLGYYNDEAATQERFSGDWFCTGILAQEDDGGEFWHCDEAGR